MLAYSRVESFVREKLSDCFSKKQIQRVSQAYLDVMMISYAQLFRIEGIDKKAEGKKLRQQIIEKGEALGTDVCRIRTRIAYKMMRRCPQLFRIAYPVYHPVRWFIHRLTGK